MNRLEAYFEEQEFALPGEDDVPPTPTGSTRTSLEEPPVPAPALESSPDEETKPQGSLKKASAGKVAAAVELAKETAKPGTEPAPAPVVPEPKPAAKQVTAEMTFAEKKAARAARFGIAVVQQPKKSPNKKRQHDSIKPESNKKQKKQQSDKKAPQKKKAPQQKKETPLLPIEEIEKRLKRAEKFGTGDNAQTQELKAMLRKHRFAASS